MNVCVIDTFQDMRKCFTDTGFCKEKWDQYISHYLPYAKEQIEKGHVWHKQNRTAAFPLLNTPKARALWQLYSEGIAMYCEQLLCDDDQFYHQNKDGWLDWCSYLNVSDLGYYLGCELIKTACETRTISHILDLSLSEIEMTLYQCIDR